MSIDNFLPDDAPKASTFEPSPYQRAIFVDAAGGEGHVVVQARAGSGKTTTILKAINHVPGEYRDDVLVAAFNSKIAGELKAKAPVGAEVMTLHSYGFRAIIRARGGKPEVDKYKVANMARELLGGSPATSQRRASLKRAVSMAKNTLTEGAEAIDEMIDTYGIDIPIGTRRDEFVADVVEVLGRCKIDSPTIDFDDQCWLPVVLEMRTRSFVRVFIDETQDLNRTQLALALGAVRKGGRICAVGDPAQAIYGFRGADVQAMPRVIQHLGARVLPLSVCYRCGSSIVREAQRYVPDIEAAPNAPEGSVTEAVADVMKRDARPGDFILSRTNAPLMSLCLGFLREGRRAAVQGKDIGEDFQAFVRRARDQGIGSVKDFLEHVEDWRDSEVARLAARDRDVEPVYDKALCLLTVADGARDLGEIDRRLGVLFADDDDRSRIVLSTTHRAKGLERQRAFLLWSTFRPHQGGQEQNLAYVAITRAQSSLIYVGGAP